jgi:hypothetical protein
MNDNREYGRTRSERFGWGILLVMSALLMLAGISWFITLPELALGNIAERTSLEPAGFMAGGAFGVITMIARGYGAGYAVLGLMALLVSLEGYRNGTRWAWTVMWALVLAYAALAGTFLLAGESYALSLGILSFALAALAGLLLARKDLSSPSGETVSLKG